MRTIFLTDRLSMTIKTALTIFILGQFKALSVRWFEHPAQFFRLTQQANFAVNSWVDDPLRAFLAVLGQFAPSFCQKWSYCPLFFYL